MFRRKRDRHQEEEEEEEEEEGEMLNDDVDEEEEERRRKKKRASCFFEEEAIDGSADEGEDDDNEPEDCFIVHDAADVVPDNDDDNSRMPRRHHRMPFFHQEEGEDDEDLETLAKNLQQRYERSDIYDEGYGHDDDDDDVDAVDQQSLLPSVRDPKLWRVKCAIGRERESAVCLMQKYIDNGSDLHILSATALDNLKNYIFVEAEKESHVREACKGFHNIYPHQITLVPIKEMTDVLSVHGKTVDLATGTWVRMKIQTYKGDLAQVVGVDNVQQKVRVKLIPRFDLRELANKLEGKEVVKKKAFVQPRLMNVNEARELNIRVDRRRDAMTGDYFELIDGKLFKDGFLYKDVSLKSVTTQNIKPTIDELEKFHKPGDTGDGEVASLSTLLANRKKGHFMKGDAVIIIKGDLKNLKGWVEKVDEESVHIRPEEKGPWETLAVNEKELCKYFESGNHVKIIFGTHEGVTGTVVKVEQHVVTIVSDATKEHITVFADSVVKSSEVTTGVTRLGDYELHDLVVLDDLNFGIIIRVDCKAFQILKGVPGRSDVAIVSLRDIKCKIEKEFNVKDRHKNVVSMNDVVRIIDGPFKGKRGRVKHIYRGLLFIYDHHHLESAGFICSESHSCVLVGGSRAKVDGNGDSYLRFGKVQTPPCTPSPSGRFPIREPLLEFRGRSRSGRGCHDSLVGTRVRICKGPYSGYCGRVVQLKSQKSVQVELEAQMRIVTVDNENYRIVSNPHRLGSETPAHPSRTPMHPYATPMRDVGATPSHDGMRTPMRSNAWNPYSPMSPPRDNWEDGNPATWGASLQRQSGRSPLTYEAPTPGSYWASSPSCSFNEPRTPRDSNSYVNAPSPYLRSTPSGQPMTPNSASCYLPSTPWGKPVTPGIDNIDAMTPLTGGCNEGPCFMPDILVRVSRTKGDTVVGVIREVLPDGSYKVEVIRRGTISSGETVTAFGNEIEKVPPRVSDKIKILSGDHRGATARLISVDGASGIVKLDDNLQVTVLSMAILGKVDQS